MRINKTRTTLLTGSRRNKNTRNKNIIKKRIIINDNPILGNQLVVMSRADLDALVEKMASNMIAMRVEDKNTHESDLCSVMHDYERFIARKETAKLFHVDYSTLWR